MSRIIFQYLKTWFHYYFFYLGVIKAGFAGDTIPKCIFLNLVGKPKHVRVMAGALEGDNFIGKLPYLVANASNQLSFC